MSFIKRSVLCVLGVMLLSLVGAGSAFAEAPWWHLTSSTRPTYIQPGEAQNSVVDLTVSATKGEVLLAEPEDMHTYLIPGARKPALEDMPHAVVPYDASAKLVQEALEVVFPRRTVLVAEGSGDTPETRSYVITFVGQTVYSGEYEPVFASGELATLYGGEALSGGRAEASVKTVSADGRPDGQIIVTAANLGDADANPEGQPVTLKDVLPAGLEAVAIEGGAVEEGAARLGDEAPLECSLGSLSCTFTGKAPSFMDPEDEEESYASLVPPYEQLEMRISVKVREGAQAAKTGAVNEASVTGGGAPSVDVKQPLTVSDAPIPSGASSYELRPEEEGGAVDTQAGSHPFQLTTALVLSQTQNTHREPNYAGNDIWVGETAGDRAREEPQFQAAARFDR